MKHIIKTFIFLLVLAFLSSCGGSIDSVKNGTLAIDPSITVGDALDGYKYFDDIEWEEFTDSQGREIVEFKGIFDLDEFEGFSVFSQTITEENIEKIEDMDMVFTYKVQFAIDKSGKSFRLKDSVINMQGIHQKTNKLVNKDVNIDSIDTLKTIFNNKPVMEIVGLLIG
jgi:hypothetical protein